MYTAIASGILCSITMLAIASPVDPPARRDVAFVEAYKPASDYSALRNLKPLTPTVEPTPVPAPEMRSSQKPDSTENISGTTLRLLPRDSMIPAGTVIDVRLTSTMRTDTYQEGDIIGFEVVQPVVVGGMVVIEKGAAAKGSVVKLKRARTFGRGGDLFFRIFEVTAVNGRRVPVTFTYRFKGVNDHARTNTEMIVTGTAAGLASYGILAPVALLYGPFRKGSEAEQPFHKQFEVAVAANTPLEGNELADTPAIFVQPGQRSSSGAFLPGYGLPAMFDSSRTTMKEIMEAGSLRDLKR